MSGEEGGGGRAGGGETGEVGTAGSRQRLAGDRMRRADQLALLLLSTLSVLTRFAYLAHPREVVFDEYHFGKFVNGYLTGMRAFARGGGHGGSPYKDKLCHPLGSRSRDCVG